MPRLTLIAAMATNRVIGRDGGIPWRLPDDLAFFKQVTMGHHLVMGRKTWASLGRPLPGRVNVVLSRDPSFSAEGAVVASGLDPALSVAAHAGDDEVFVIGGEAVYRSALGRASRIFLTRVDAEIEGDVRFPELDEGWVECDRRSHDADARHAYGFAICELRRGSQR